MRRLPFYPPALFGLFALLLWLSACSSSSNPSSQTPADNTPPINAPAHSPTTTNEVENPPSQDEPSASGGLVICLDDSLQPVIQEITDLMKQSAGFAFTLKADNTEQWLLALGKTEKAPFCDLVLLEGQESILSLLNVHAVRREGARALAADQLVLFSRADEKVPDAFKALSGAQKKTVSVAHGNTFTGIHTENILKRLGLLPKKRPALRIQDTRRKVLRRVLRRQERLGIAYRADVLTEPKLKVLMVFPQPALHEIVYWGAVTNRSIAPDVSRETLQLLTSQTMGHFWKSHHFQAPSQEARSLAIPQESTTP